MSTHSFASGVYLLYSAADPHFLVDCQGGFGGWNWFSDSPRDNISVNTSKLSTAEALEFFLFKTQCIQYHLKRVSESWKIVKGQFLRSVNWSVQTGSGYWHAVLKSVGILKGEEVKRLSVSEQVRKLNCLSRWASLIWNPHKCCLQS